VLLALEIVASRIVAPYFGNSIYVWGSLIGVFLAALSLGYLGGGRIATRWPTAGPFLILVLAGGMAIVPIPRVASFILAAITQHDYGPRANALLGCTALFFLPCVLLGAISPYAVRLKTETVEGVGKVAGTLYALSTLGSIVGTLVAAFFLIPALGVTTIVRLLGAIEMSLALLGLLWLRYRRFVAGGLVLAILALNMTWGERPDGPTVIFAKDTIYHRITVDEDGSYRYLRLDRYWQSGWDVQAPLRTVFPYTDYLHLALIFNHNLRRALFIGLGGGIAPSRFLHDYPHMQIDVVELDPAVVDVARKFFALPSTSRLRVYTQDGRLWLRRTPNRYDLIVLDAYLIDTIPFHLATKEFYAELATHLVPGGVVASNVIGALKGPRSRLFRSIYKTFTSVFPSVYVFPVEGDAEGALQNIIMVGTYMPHLNRREIMARAADLERSGIVGVPGYGLDAATIYSGYIDIKDVPILTDDYAPAELLSSPP
jgi:spermidine synthase